VRRGLAVGLAIVAALALPAVAAAHATLLGASPETQSKVAKAPTQVRLEFSESVSVTSGAIQVLAPDGTVLSGTSKASHGRRVVTAPVSGLVRGSA
jgi:methionine-rich copper-binding protein CopC